MGEARKKKFCEPRFASHNPDMNASVFEANCSASCIVDRPRSFQIYVVLRQAICRLLQAVQGDRSGGSPLERLSVGRVEMDLNRNPFQMQDRP